MQIGIVGFGFVGQAVYSCHKQDSNFIIYDPPKNIGDLDNIKCCNVVFVCLPTPTNSHGQDFSFYKKFFDSFDDTEILFVIKSTVLYNNLKEYENRFKIVMNPEFLNENKSYNDFYKQELILLGGRIDLCQKVKHVYDNYFEFNQTPKFEYCTVKEACDFKYIHNIYHSYKILFWNFVNERVNNHRKIFDLYSKLTGNTCEMSQVAADGKRGYGGKCFPKDVNAFHLDEYHLLTDFMSQYNFKIRI